jgi:hypothetical protein
VTDTRSQRFLLAVDDGGEFFAASGESLVIGHLRSPSADLPFLADVEAEHAILAIEDSFHRGPRWSLAAASGSRILVGGRFVDAKPVLLADGDPVQLAPNLAFRFRAPDPASGSAVLDLQSGVDCQGARHVLLFAPGVGGRVRIAARADRLIPVPELTQEVSLEIDSSSIGGSSIGASSLVVRCPGGVRVQGGISPGGSDPTLVLPCPPTQPISLDLGARAAGRPPFGLTFSPVRMVAAAPARPRPA